MAWVLIKIGGHVLFYQREDTKKHFDKKAEDYGLVGGRVNQYDFDDSKQEIREILPILQSSNRTQIKPVLANTLMRELSEEAGLQVDTHYTYKVWRELKPYQQAQGAANNEQKNQ